MSSRTISQQHFCISIVAGFDVYNSVVRLTPGKNDNDQHSKLDKPKKKSNKDKNTLTGLYASMRHPASTDTFLEWTVLLFCTIIYFFLGLSHYPISLLYFNESNKKKQF